MGPPQPNHHAQTRVGLQPPPRGCRPQPFPTENKPRTQQQITLIPAEPYVRRKPERRCAIPERYAQGKVSVEGPDEPHSRSARNEGAGLSFRVRTLRLCPCVVMRGLRCFPRSKIRGSKLYNTDIGIKLLTRRIGRRVAHWRCGPKDRCAGVKNV